MGYDEPTPSRPKSSRPKSSRPKTAGRPKTGKKYATKLMPFYCCLLYFVALLTSRFTCSQPSGKTLYQFWVCTIFIGMYKSTFYSLKISKTCNLLMGQKLRSKKFLTNLTIAYLKENSKMKVFQENSYPQIRQHYSLAPKWGSTYTWDWLIRHVQIQ